jgi:hypothetical protein
MTRRFYVGSHRWKQRAVLQNRNAVAFVHGAAGEAGECLQAVVQRLQLIERQVQVRRQAPMREHEATLRAIAAFAR